MHIALGTPMFAAQCTLAFHRSVGALRSAIERDGHKLSSIHIGNESLIHRARNAIVWHFLQGAASHLLWVDGDTGFEVGDIARMVAANKPIIVAPCPMKAINWERVATAVRAGVPANELERYTGYFNVVHKPGRQVIRADQPFEIERGGTGLMLVQRQVFDAVAPLARTYLNKNHGSALPFGERVVHFHPSDVADDDLRSEDYGFCDLAKQAGFAIWAAPWCEIAHVGTYTFRGSYQDCHRTTEEPDAH